MNVTIQITPSEALKGLLQRARNFPAETLQAVGKALAASGPAIVGEAVKYRFTNQRGPFPVSENKLGATVEKPRLRNSITHTKPQINPGSNEVTMGFGSNVKYFGVHEFGFSGSVGVKAHQRKGRPVRAHSRYVKVPARAPMQTELRHPRTEEIIFKNAARAITSMLAKMEGGTP
jgi:hypothetical protein